MAFLDDQNPPFFTAQLSVLRGLDTSALTATATAFVSATSPSSVMRYNPQLLEPEDLEAGIIIPDDKDASTPGRWVFERWT